MESRQKKLYYVCDSVKELLELDVKQRIKVVSTGVKVFERQDNKDLECAYRLLQEGVPLLQQGVTKQIMKVRGREG